MRFSWFYHYGLVQPTDCRFHPERLGNPSRRRGGFEALQSLPRCGRGGSVPAVLSSRKRCFKGQRQPFSGWWFGTCFYFPQ